MLAPFHTTAELSQMKEVEPVTFVIPVVICVIRFVNVDYVLKHILKNC